MTLSGALAFAALREELGGRVRAEEPLDEPAFERLRGAMADRSATLLDRAVLLRQALLYETARRSAGPLAEFYLKSDWEFSWGDVGIVEARSAGGTKLRAMPWTPSWLWGAECGVDDWAASEVIRRFGDQQERVSGDPFLTRVGWNTYRSRGQRAAARATLATPPGMTLAVVLATGEGKSLLFRLIDTVGFADDAPDGRPGVTLVIVPTIALGIDHAMATGGSLPRAWQGGATERNAAIATAVRHATQGLCFRVTRSRVRALAHATP